MIGAWSDLNKNGRGAGWFVTAIYLVVILGLGGFFGWSASGFFKKRPSQADRIEALETKLAALEDGTSTFQGYADRTLLEHRMELDIIATEVETLSFHYIESQNVILFLNPKVDRFLAWRIAFYTVVVSDSYGVDPFFVLALMHHESNFDPKAKSNAVVTTKGKTWYGARGLMQVMGFWANDYGMEEADLWDTRNNIDAGVGIIEDCLHNHDDDLAGALGEYHGSGRDGKYAADVKATYERIKVAFPRRHELEDYPYGGE